MLFKIPQIVSVIFTIIAIIFFHIFYNYSNLKITDNTNYFYEQPGQYLRHITTFAHCVSPANKRVPYFRKFVSALKIDFRASINTVRIIEYDTVEYMNKMNESV